MHRHLSLVASVATALTVSASVHAAPSVGELVPTAARSTQPAAASMTISSARTATASQARQGARPIVGTVVRFSRGGVNVDVTIKSDHPTSRDFLSLLPLTLSVEELAGREKISYLPRRLRTKGSPGSDPADGDLIYYAPWGNLGFYYDADGIGYSDDTINLGTYRAAPRRLERLQRGPVRVRVFRRGGDRR